MKSIEMIIISKDWQKLGNCIKEYENIANLFYKNRSIRNNSV